MHDLKDDYLKAVLFADLYSNREDWTRAKEMHEQAAQICRQLELTKEQEANHE